MKSMLFLVFAVFFFDANAQSKIDEINIKKGVDQFVRVYKEGGMSGAAVEVGSCYEQVSTLKQKSSQKYSKFEYCLSIDLAARRWDTDAVERYKFPRTEFFELDAMNARLAGFNEFELRDRDDRFTQILDFVNQYVYISFQNANQMQTRPIKSKKSDKVTTSTPASTIDLESKAKDFISDLFSSFSSNNESGMNFFIKNMKKDVMFYGKRTSKDIILKEKEKFMKRWPTRSYVERPESLNIKCDSAENSCLIEVVIDWDARNSNKISIGVGKFFYELQFINGSPQIAAESSEVIERK